MRTPWAAVLLTVPIALLGAGCGTAAAPSAGPLAACGTGTPLPTAMTVRSSAMAGDHFPTSDVYSHDARQVTDVFRGFCQLESHPVTPSGTSNCPADFGLVYRGSFTGRDGEIATFVWHASGCQELSLTRHGRSTLTTALVGRAAASGALLRSFATVIGVSCVQALFSPPMVARCPTAATQ